MNLDEMSKADSQLSILVVDDDELNQRMMKLLLKKEGHLVECASNGLEAFNAVKAQAYDLVLMDLQMPVMDGVDASRHIRAWENENRRTFIVALTASFLPEKGRELYEAGIDNYIAKPFDMDHLRNILQFGLEKRKQGASEVPGPPKEERVQAHLDVDFQAGIQRVGGSEQIYKELLGDFVEELPGKLESLKRHCQERDMTALNRAAHNLKGVSASLGALLLSDHARRLEKEVGAGYTDAVEGILDDLSASLHDFRVKASEFISADVSKIS